MSANDKQIGGSHYKAEGGEEHWDRVHRMGLNYFQAAATKYIERCYLKGNPVQDLHKAAHFIEKLIEIETEKLKQPLEPSVPSAVFCSHEKLNWSFTQENNSEQWVQWKNGQQIRDVMCQTDEPGRGYVNQDR